MAEEIAELGLAGDLRVAMARTFLVEGDLDRQAATEICDTYLKDGVAEKSVVAAVGSDTLAESPVDQPTLGQRHGQARRYGSSGPKH